tara:strand:+ start:186 stop:533 length:348 start_codon:yes stop_codon:yes gene_type:complete
MKYKFTLLLLLCFNFGFSQGDYWGVSGDWYVTTATTRNSSGDNYSVSVRIRGKKPTHLYNDGCLRIYETQVSSGRYWEKVQISEIYNEECAYKFTFGDWNLGGSRDDYYFIASAN